MAVKQNMSDNTSEMTAGMSEGRPIMEAPMPQSAHPHHSAEVKAMER